MEGRVVRICVAPVKALHIVNPDEVELTHAGVVGDRRFWLVDAQPAGSSTGSAIPSSCGCGRSGTRTRAGSRSRSPTARSSRARWSRGSRSRPSCTGRRIRRGSCRGRGRRRCPSSPGEPLTLLWSEGGAQDRGNDRGGWASMISRGSLDAARRGGRRGGAGRRPPLPDAVRDRRRRAARGGHVARQAASRSATR